MKNKLLKCLTLLFVLCTAITVSAKDIDSGTFKNGGSWKISEQGELYVDAETVPDRVCHRTSTKIHTNANDSSIYFIMVNQDVTPAPWDAYLQTIRSIRISQNTKTIGEWAFYYLAYVKTVIFDSRSNADLVIKRNAFDHVGCATTYGLKTLDLTYVKSIGTQAFAGCEEIRNVILGDNLTSVGDSVFVGCSGLWEEGSYIKLPNNNTLGTNYQKLVPNTKMTWFPNGSGVKNYPYFDLSFVRYIAPMSAYGQYGPSLGNENFKLYYGELGEWLVSAGTLYIYRDKDYASPSDRPWHSIAGNITAAEISTTTIGKNTFNGCSSLHFVNSTGIEAHLDNITKIGENAFYGCQQLKMVDMPRIQEIGSSAFENSGLTNVRFNSILKNRNHEKGFKSIGSNAFKNTPLARVEVFGDRPQTSSNAFQSLTSSQKVLVAPPYFSIQYEQAPWDIFTLDLAVDFPVRLWSNNWGWELTADGVLTIMGNANNLFWDDVRQVPWYPYRKYIRKVVVAEGITALGKNALAFENEGESQIAEVVVPASVETIGDNAFKNNDQIEKVEAEGVKNIGNQAFENCSSLEEVKLGDNVKSLGEKVFNNCGLVDVMAVKSATPPAITARTFEGLGSMSANAPAKVKAKYAARRAKAATGQKSVSLEVPDAHISKYLAAQYWNLFSFEFIGEHGGIVESDLAYDGLYVLYSDGTMIISASAPTDPQNINSGFTISSNAKSKVKRVEIQGLLTKLGHQFNDCPNLEEVVLSGGINSLNGTFNNCPKLKTINLENVQYLKSHQQGNKVIPCFGNCAALQEVNIPNVLEIGDNCFKGCAGLTKVALGGEAEVGMEAFSGCTSLKRIALGNAKLNGALQAFQGCTALEEMTYSGTRMPAEIFKGCTALHKINLGGSLKDILSEAFANTSIDSIYVQCPTPPEAAANAFSGITLSSIKVMVPDAFDGPYWSAPVWEEMFFYDDEDYAELDFPIHFAIGSNGWGVVDNEGNLTINATGALVSNIREYVEPYAPYINSEIRIGNEVSSIPGGTPYSLPFGWVTEDGPRALVLGSGVTEIGDYAFYNNAWDRDLIIDCYAMLPPDVKGEHAFNMDMVGRGEHGEAPATLNVVNDPDPKGKYGGHWFWKKFMVGGTLEPADAPAECTVTFVDWDGTILQQTTTRPGMMVTPPADPVRDGYTFKGWDSQDYTWVVSDLTITAVYFEESFVVRFYDWDGTQLIEQMVHYGQAAVAPADPARDGYTFLGWSEDFSFITTDRYIIAMYKNDSEGIEDVLNNAPKAVKIIAGDQILILRDGKVYTVTGMQVK